MARARPSTTDAAVRSFTAVIEPDEADGGYVVTFPAIPDLATQGETLDEARRMADRPSPASARYTTPPYGVDSNARPDRADQT